MNEAGAPVLLAIEGPLRSSPSIARKCSTRSTLRLRALAEAVAGIAADAAVRCVLLRGEGLLRRRDVSRFVDGDPLGAVEAIRRPPPCRAETARSFSVPICGRRVGCRCRRGLQFASGLRSRACRRRCRVHPRLCPDRCEPGRLGDLPAAAPVGHARYSSPRALAGQGARGRRWRSVWSTASCPQRRSRMRRWRWRSGSPPRLHRRLWPD